jgi:ATP-dependent Clp protease ATP-binding subunit ClpA
MRTVDTSLRGNQVRGLLRKFEHLIVGQNEAIEKITNLLERYLGGLSDTYRPIGSALLLGPSGVGKTSLVEAMCEGLYGSPDHMVKIDCAEFQMDHEIAKLIGSPPGYLGHKETPARMKQETITKLYTADVPFGVVLFDEIEKASDGVWQLLLGILDRGTLTLGDNSKTDFTKCFILMTSNCGAREIMDGKVGFDSPTSEEATHKEITDSSLSAARKKFTPEFLNRLDELVVFNSLDRATIEKIMHLEFNKCRDKLIAKAGIKMEVSPAAFKELLERGFDKKYNARGIRRTLEKEIMTPMARAISSFEVTWGDTIVMDYHEKFQFHNLTPLKEEPDGIIRIYPEASLSAGQFPLSGVQSNSRITPSPYKV